MAFENLLPFHAEDVAAKRRTPVLISIANLSKTYASADSDPSIALKG